MQKRENTNEFVGIRVKKETKNLLEKLINSANKKTLGRKIKVDELVQLALTLVETLHIQELQNRSLSNEDKKEKLRQIYMKKNGQISKDEFTGFMLREEFSRFLEENKTALVVA